MKNSEKGKICPWRKVLNEILDYAPKVYDDEKRTFEGIRVALFEYSHPLAEKLNISCSELHDSLDFMEKMELIKITDSTIPPIHPIELTLKGFEVAETYKKQKLGAIFNSVLIYLTSIIWLTSLFAFVNELKLIENLTLFCVYILAGIIFALIWYYLIFKPLSPKK